MTDKKIDRTLPRQIAIGVLAVNDGEAVIQLVMGTPEEMAAGEGIPSPPITMKAGQTLALGGIVAHFAEPVPVVQPGTAWTSELIAQMRQAYDKAVAAGDEEFTFLDQPVLVGYAKYLLEHLEPLRRAN